MQTAYLALGSNLGDRLHILRGGRSALHDADGVRVEAASAIYETEPVGGPAGQGPYLNAVLRVETSLSPRQLLALCQQVEERFGRQRDTRWGARTLDVDILVYGDVVVQAPDLVLPHPRLHERPFVLVPLLDVEADPARLAQAVAPGPLSATLCCTAGVRRTSFEW